MLDGNALLVLSAIFLDNCPNMISRSSQLGAVSLCICFVAMLDKKVVGYRLFADQLSGLFVDCIAMLICPR